MKRLVRPLLLLAEPAENLQDEYTMHRDGKRGEDEAPIGPTARDGRKHPSGDD